jgi:hypothetical protein
LIAACRTLFVAWWAVGGELGGGVFGFPSLSFGDGVQQQDRPGWHVGINGCGAFPPVGPVLGAVARLNACGFEELPNECAALGAVIIESLVDHFRETKTRRPAMPRCSGWWALPLQCPGVMECRAPLGWIPYKSHTAHRGEQGVI